MVWLTFVCDGGPSGHDHQLHHQETVVMLFRSLFTGETFVIATKYIRDSVVFVTLLLAAAANLMYCSCDADHDEATPPVIVEFHFVVRARSSLGSQAAVILPTALTPARIPNQALSLKSLTVSARAPLPAEQSSAQVALPLLC